MNFARAGWSRFLMPGMKFFDVRFDTCMRLRHVLPAWRKFRFMTS